MQPQSSPAHAGTHRSGQMTAVMRAVERVDGPRVLRVGLVEGGRLVLERTFAKPARVTLGSSERATFVIGAREAPGEVALFERIGDEYFLDAPGAMAGRIAMDGKVIDLASLRDPSDGVEGAVRRFKLTSDARGKLTGYGVSVLFQLVAPLPPAPRPKLPLSVQQTLGTGVDWTFTILAALSFLVHFGLVGSMYADWTDPIVDERVTVGALIDMLPVLPAAQVEEAAADPSAENTPSPSATAPSPHPNPGAHESGGRQGPAAANATDYAALASRAHDLQLELVGAFKGGSALQGVLNQREIPPVGLDAAAESSAGARAHNGTGLDLGTGGGPVKPGSARGGLASIGNVAAAAATTAGVESTVAGPPKGTTSIGPIGKSVPVANAERVVASLRPGFRACYQHGLASDSSMAGRVLVTTRIAPNGEVASADPTQTTGLSSDVVQCVLRRVRTATFDAPGATGATIEIPVVFYPQNNK